MKLTQLCKEKLKKNPTLPLDPCLVAITNFWLYHVRCNNKILNLTDYGEETTRRRTLIFQRKKQQECKIYFLKLKN